MDEIMYSVVKRTEYPEPMTSTQIAELLGGLSDNEALDVELWSARDREPMPLHLDISEEALEDHDIPGNQTLFEAAATDDEGFEPDPMKRG